MSAGRANGERSKVSTWLPWVAIVGLLAGAGAWWWSMQGPDQQRIDRALKAAESELALEVLERDSMRGVLAELRQVAAQEGDSEALAIARSRVLARLGDPLGAWEELSVRVSAPGAGAEVRAEGARRLAAVFATSGDPEQGGRAFDLAERAAEMTGTPELRLLAWQLAFRIGDLDAFRRLADALSAGGGETADAVQASVRVLGRLLALRRGLVVDGEDAAAAPDPERQEIVAWLQGLPPSDAERLHRVAARFPTALPELEIAIAYRALERVGGGGDDDEILGEYFEELERLQAVIRDQPSSLEARLGAVVALVLIGERRGSFVDEERRRLRGYVEWLLANAPAAHAQRDFWGRLQAQLR